MMRWLQLTYKVPSEPSQKRVWVWRRLQNLGAYALQNSVYLLPYTEEVEKHFRQLAHDIREMEGEASIFVVEALDKQDEQRILQALLEVRINEYLKVVKVCQRFFTKAVKLVEKQDWNDQVHAEFAEVLEKVHVLFRAARRHDLLAEYTSTARANAAEALAICEQVFRTLLDKDFGKALRLIDMHRELLDFAIESDDASQMSSVQVVATHKVAQKSLPPSHSPLNKKMPATDESELLEPPI